MPTIKINTLTVMTYNKDNGWKEPTKLQDLSFGFAKYGGANAISYKFVCPNFTGNDKAIKVEIEISHKLSVEMPCSFNVSVTSTNPKTTGAYITQVLGPDTGRIGSYRVSTTVMHSSKEIVQIPVSNTAPGSVYFIVLSPCEDTEGVFQTNAMLPCELSYSVKPSTIVIPRNRKLYLGDEITISINRYSKEVRHRITYEFGSKSGVILDGAIDPDEVVWTPPLSLGEAVPDAMAGKCAITCETVFDGEVIGVSTLQFSLYMPSATFKPSASISSVMPVSDNSVVSGWRAFVQGYSKVRIDVAAFGIYGSGISKCEISIIGVGDYVGTSILSDTISISGTVQINCTVTDTRGQQASASTQIYVYPYARPSLSGIICHRSDADGKYSKDGAHYYTIAYPKYSSIGGRNTFTVESRCKVSGGEYGDPQPASTGIPVVSGGDLSPYQTYIVQLMIRDALSETPYFITIPNEREIFKIKDGGRSIGIGTVPTEDDLMDVGIDARFQAGVRISGEYPKLQFTVGNTVVGEIGSYSDGPTIGNMFIRVYDSSGKYKEYTWSAS